MPQGHQVKESLHESNIGQCRLILFITCLNCQKSWLFYEKNNREYQSQNPIAYCIEGWKCSWKMWCPLFSNSDLSGRGQGRDKMQMIFIKCKCFSSLCSLRHKNGQYVHGAYFKYTIRLEIRNRTVTITWRLRGNWRGQCWSLFVSVQRCLRTQTSKNGFSGSQKNFQSSN